MGSTIERICPGWIIIGDFVKEWFGRPYRKFSGHCRNSFAAAGEKRTNFYEGTEGHCSLLCNTLLKNIRKARNAR